jgi:methyl-accepting chemotaxis protein
MTALGVGGLVVVSVIYLVGWRIEGETREQADRSAALAGNIAALSEDLLEARQVANEFLQKRNQATIANHAKIIEHAQSRLADIQALVAPLDEGDPLKQAEGFGAGINMYVIRFQSVVSAQRSVGLSENDGLQGELRDAVHKVEARLGQLDQPRLMVLMLMMRRHEKDFILRGDEKYGDELGKRVTEFEDALASATIDANTKAELKTLIESYQSSFVGFMTQQSSLREEAEDLAAIYNRLRPSLVAVKDGAATRYAQAQMSAAGLRQNVLYAIGFMAALVGLLALYFGQRVSRPIVQIVAVMRQLIAGNLDAPLPKITRADEIGDMAKAVAAFRAAAIEKVQLENRAAEQRQHADEQRLRSEDERRRNAEAQADAAAEQARAIAALADGLTKLADGDLMIRLDDGFTESYRRIKDDFNRMIERLEQTIVEIAAATHEVTNASAEISTSSSDLSQRTEEQAASLEETSAAMEEISKTVKQNAESARQANASAARACDVAYSGGKVITQAVEAMAQIEGSSRKVSDIIGVIDEIARQTNLLALNAAIEAARAGEAGRGFAVVASEVRSLAQRSAQAAKDITDLITSSSGQVQRGVDLVNKGGAALTEIVESIKNAAAIVSDIAAASAEQATGLDQVNTALAQMNEVTQQNSALIEENAATARTLEQQAAAMDERVGSFRIDAALAEATSMRAAPQSRRVSAA